MPNPDCPNCTRPVAPTDDTCPSCGANLGLTVPRTPATEVTAPARRATDFTPGQRFAGRFTVIERVGAGGMGVVYKAIDTALESQVGLKVIRPELAEIPSFAARFRREVRLTRQITHPNVCRVHDLGESDGVLYLSMEWIEGETLDQLLRQAGTLRDARALEIASRIAEALEAAHAAGVVHRDLKPGNVMIDRRGKVSVLDFGLALEHGSPELTGPGLVLGTPRYMAPEQRAGRTVDARADLYALGLVLVQMLVGQHAEAGARALPPELNPVFLPLLRKLLAEDPADRYSSATAVVEALRGLEGSPAISMLSTVAVEDQGVHRRRGWLTAGAVALVGITVMVLALWPTDELPPAVRASYERGMHYLEEESETVDGIRNAIQMFQRAQEAAPKSARVQARLSEAYWMWFRRGGGTPAREEAERWSERAAALDPELPELGNARALGFLAEGKHDAAKAELERALAQRADFVSALLNLGMVERERGDYAAGLAALERAERLAPANFRVQLALGRLHEKFQEQDLAVACYRRALELKPDSTIAWNNLSSAYLKLDRLPEAADALRKSVELDEYADARSNLGTLYYTLDRFDDAIEQFRRAAELEPARAVLHSNLGDALGKVGRREEARQAYVAAATAARERLVREPTSLEAHADAALFCAQAGDVACAIESVAEVGRAAAPSADQVLMCAAALAQLGRDGESLDWLERAIRLGITRAELETRPELDRLSGNPRYAALLARAR